MRLRMRLNVWMAMPAVLGTGGGCRERAAVAARY